MLILANDIEKTVEIMEQAGVWPTLVVVSLVVAGLRYLVRLIENAVRALHKKPYMEYMSFRFILSTIGYVLVADGFVIGGVFESVLPLPWATITIMAGLLCLIANLAISVVPYVRQVRRVGGEKK